MCTGCTPVTYVFLLLATTCCAQEFKDIYYKPVSSYCEVKKTKKLGQGAYGSVYLGTISNQVCVHCDSCCHGEGYCGIAGAVCEGGPRAWLNMHTCAVDTFCSVHA